MNNEPIETEMQLEVIEPSALEALERANVDLQITTARRYPRKLGLVKQRMMNLATLDEETAASCFYKLARSGRSIEGPSIRLAEIAASSFGNIRYGARVVANDGKRITAQGFCHDLETNVLFTIEVQRRITNREGVTYNEDMQTVTGNAACAIAARNAIFKVVPFAFVKPIFLAAKQVAVGDITTLADRRSKMAQKFSALGVNDKRICESLGKSGMEEIGLGELETLIGLYGAIRDGDQTVDEAFPMPAKTEIKFGPSGVLPEPQGETTGTISPPPNDLSGAHEGNQTSAPNEKPKRHRRTKAQIAADEAARHSAESESGEARAEADGSAAIEKPALATPLQGLQNLLASSPITPEQFRTHLAVTDRIAPGFQLETLPDEKIRELQRNFMVIADEILEPKPFA